MTTMVAEIYDALLAPGSPDDKARKAAEAIAQVDTRMLILEAAWTERWTASPGCSAQIFHCRCRSWARCRCRSTDRVAGLLTDHGALLTAGFDIEALNARVSIVRDR